MTEKSRNNPESFGSKALLAGLVALCSFFGSVMANWIDTGVEYRRTINHLTATRQSTELESAKQEIEKMIAVYQDFLTEIHVVFDNLTESRQANFERPLFGIEEIGLDQRALGEKLTRLGRDVVPRLQNSYEQLVNIHGVALSEEIASVPRGINVIIAAWFGRKGSPPELVLPTNSSNLWLPGISIKLPPGSPEEANNLKIICLDKAKAQIELLTESRKKLIDGKYE